MSLGPSQDIPPGSPAARGGLRAGDIILALDGVAVTGADDLIRLLAGEKIGRTVAVDVGARFVSYHYTDRPELRGKFDDAVEEIKFLTHM